MNLSNPIKIIFFSIIFILSISNLNSQTQITLEKAIELGLDNNKELKMARLSLQKAEADIDEAYSYALPSLNLSGSYTRNLLPLQFYIEGGFGPGGETGGTFIAVSADNAIDARVELNQTLFNAAVFRSINATDNYYNVAKERTKNIFDNVVFSIKQSFYTALLQKENLELLKTAKEKAEGNFQDINIMFEEGLISEFDKIRAEVQVANFEPQITNANNQYKTALNNLKMIIGFSSAENINIEESLTDFSTNSIQKSLEEIEKEILLNNPILKSLEVQQEVNKDFIAVYEADYLPNLSLFGNYSLVGQANDFDFLTVNTSQVGLRLNMNLFQGFRTNAMVEKAEIDLMNTKLQREQTELQIKVEIRDLLERMKSNNLQLKANKLNIAQAERGYEIAKTRFETGVGSLLELNDAELALRTAQFNNLRTVYDMLSNNARLEALLGDNSKDIKF